MPLHYDSYTTTAGSITDTRKIVSAIKEAMIADDLDQKPESKLRVQSYGDYQPLFITGTYPSEAKIPPFAHPISVLNIRGNNFICTDLRLFLKKDLNSEFDKRISNRVDFDYAISRTVLNLFWVGGRASEFTSGFRFSAKVFAEWVCQILNGGLGLEVQELVPVEIAALTYYYSLCQDSVVDVQQDKQRIVDWIYSLTGHQATGIAAVVDKLRPMSEFTHFIENLKVILENIRVQKLTAGIFITLARSSWYGVNASQVLGVCIEHPPTWTAIIYHTLSSKSYQRCLIGQVALKAGKRGDADAFMRHYSEMFSNSMRMESQDNTNKIDNHAPSTDKLVQQVEEAAEEVGQVATANDYDYDGPKLAFEAAMKMPLLS